MLPETFTKPVREIKLLKKHNYYFTKTVIVQMFASKGSAVSFINHTRELWGQYKPKKSVFPKGVKPRR